MQKIQIFTIFINLSKVNHSTIMGDLSNVADRNAVESVVLFAIKS